MKEKRTTLAEKLHTEGTVLFPIHGISMLPMLRERSDCVFVEKASFQELVPMDVVLYHDQTETSYILHRLLWKECHTAVMLGDNCTSIERVPEERILGRLCAFFHGEKKIEQTDIRYRLYVSLWAKPWKLRMKILQCRNYGHRIGNRIKTSIRKGTWK